MNPLIHPFAGTATLRPCTHRRAMERMARRRQAGNIRQRSVELGNPGWWMMAVDGLMFSREKP